MYFEEVRKRLDLPWVPPCVNRSDATFKVVEGALVYALGALKNVGVEAMKLSGLRIPDDREQIAANAIARRLEQPQRGVAGNRCINSAASVLQNI